MRSSLPFPALLILMGCILSENNPDPVDGLPPPTQEGKNTFGFRLNGTVWKPKGYSGTPNLDATYDPGFRGGSLGISAYFIEGNTFQSISFGGNNITNTGTYVIAYGDDLPGAHFSDFNAECIYIEPDTITGQFIINKLDLVNGIVAGTFQFTFSKPGCEVMNVTEGRFDIKIW